MIFRLVSSICDDDARRSLEGTQNTRSLSFSHAPFLECTNACTLTNLDVHTLTELLLFFCLFVCPSLTRVFNAPPPTSLMTFDELILQGGSPGDTLLGMRHVTAQTVRIYEWVDVNG